MGIRFLSNFLFQLDDPYLQEIESFITFDDVPSFKTCRTFHFLNLKVWVNKFIGNSKTDLKEDSR